jgi:hypothetical protein
MRLRPVDPDLLAELALAQHGNRPAGAQQGNDRGDRAGQQDGRQVSIVVPCRAAHWRDS